jgi:hypothetical protein
MIVIKLMCLKSYTYICPYQTKKNKDHEKSIFT